MVGEPAPTVSYPQSCDQLCWCRRQSLSLVGWVEPQIFITTLPKTHIGETQHPNLPFGRMQFRRMQYGPTVLTERCWLATLLQEISGKDSLNAEADLILGV